MSRLPETYFEGMNLTVLADDGPRSMFTVYDNEGELSNSTLDEITVTRLGISGMTAIGMATHKATHKLHGSLPVPENEFYQALAYPFNVSGDMSQDIRVQEHGREVIVFLIFQLEKRNSIFKHYDSIENKLSELARSFVTETDLTEGGLDLVLQELNGMMRTKDIKRPFVQEMSTAEIRTSTELSSKKPRIPAELVSIIGKARTLEYELSGQLDLTGILITDNPIFAGAYYSCIETISTSKQFSNTLKEYIKFLNIIMAKSISDTDLVKRELDSIDILTRAGHILYWRSLKEKTKEILSMAVKCYAIIVKLNDDAILHITVGSVLNKLGRSVDATDSIKKGFKQYRQSGSVSLNRKMIFSKSLNL